MVIAIYGYGSFGEFMAVHLKRYFSEILIVSRSKKVGLPQGIRQVSPEEGAKADIIILSVPFASLEKVVVEISPLLGPDTLVIDVTSVKVRPVEIMLKHLPQHASILATHPLFGPESAKNGLRGHQIVIHPARIKDEDLAEVLEFLEQVDLEVVHMSPEFHDKEMAWVHALTFFVGRGLLNMNLPKLSLHTGYFGRLNSLIELEKSQSLELFETVERHNPYAREVREKFLDELHDLDNNINRRKT